MKYISTSPDQTKQIAADFAKTLKGGEFVALVGDLGSGKTTFSQGLVAALGSTARVKSPTFTVMNEYPVEGYSTIRKVVHIDFYRFSKPEELRALELDEERHPDTVILAEWPNALPTVDWNPTHTVRLTGLSEGEREIEISP